MIFGEKIRIFYILSVWIDKPKKFGTNAPSTPEIKTRIDTVYVDPRWLYDSIEIGELKPTAEYKLSSFDGEPESKTVVHQLSTSSIVEID